MRVGAASQREMVRASMSPVSLVADISRDQFSEAAGHIRLQCACEGYMRTHSGTTNVDGDRSDCGLGKSAIAVQYPDFCPVLERISPRTQFQY